MKMALFTCINGNFKIESEWSDKDGAAVAFHQKCAALHNDKTTSFKAKVMVMDENFGLVGDYMEVIDHTQAAE